MLTCRRAFEGATSANVIAAILKSEPGPLADVVPETPPAVDSVVRQCLAKDPKERWQSAHDVRLARRLGADALQPSASLEARGRPWWRRAGVGWLAADGRTMLFNVFAESSTGRFDLALHDLGSGESSLAFRAGVLSPDGRRLMTRAS